MSRIVVLGGAESGVGAAVLAKVKGFDVFLSDNGKLKDDYKALLGNWQIAYEEGSHTEEKILSADEVVKSPGIPETAPMVRKLRDKGIHVISEIEFAARYDSAKKICITGSNGKTTTTSIIYYLLKEAGLNVGLGGNIGKSYALQVATEQHDYYVLEISSFQLDGCYDFRPDIAIITNITPDHLDRYDYNMENYVRSKFRITRNLRPEDCFIFDSDDKITIDHLSKIVLQARMLPMSQTHEVEQGAYLEGQKIGIRYGEDESEIYLSELALGGKHNIYKHRLEPVLEVGDVLYVNDSKATNVDAAWYALDCQTRPVVWIVGGTDKGNDYEVLKPLVREKVRAIVCMGIDNRKFHEAFEQIVGSDKIVDTLSAEEAVKASAAFAQAGDVVLLSPCCASFDLFTCYEDRGEKFKDAVRNL